MGCFASKSSETKASRISRWRSTGIVVLRDSKLKSFISVPKGSPRLHWRLAFASMCILLEYVPIGPRFSNLISQTLLVLLKKLPPKIQGGATADSTTSEASSEAIRLSCNILVERLKPIKKKLQEEKSSIKWEDLILQAYAQAVNLSASSYFVPSNNSVNYLNYGAAVSEVEIDLLTGETRFLQTDIIYDCGQSLNPAVDLGQIEGSFMQGLGFFMLEEYETNLDGLVLEDGTWNYKIPTIDTIPQQLNVEIVNSDHHKHRVLSSKASGEPPLLLAASVHCATRSPVKQAWKQLHLWSNFDESDSTLPLGVPATMPVVKELIGLDIVERHLKWKMDNE